MSWKPAPLRTDPSQPKLPHQLLTCGQVAELLGVSRGRVRQVIATGALPSVKIGRSRFVSREQVELYHWGWRRPVGRPRGSVQYRVDVLGRRRKVTYPNKNDYEGRRRSEQIHQQKLNARIKREYAEAQQSA